MSKIFNVRLPNASQQYSPEQFNQLIRSLEQVVLQLNNTYGSVPDQNQAAALNWFGPTPGGSGFSAGIRGAQISNGIALPYAMIVSETDQTNGSITAENLITYDSVSPANGISVTSNSRIKVPCAGNYLVTFTLQVTNRGTSAAEFEVWFKNTGTNIALTNTRFDIAARKSANIWAHIVPAITGIFTINNPATEYLEVAWWSDSLDVYLEHYAAGTSPTRPEIPSVILTINFVSAF
ncbi:hypothetical protein EBS40_04270 [bacterium]|nr:hypothetical protein [bacterium]